ncbi:MAG: phosphopantetheine-binding protein [Eubacteriales bacterium]|nr:phosphopantetheine-binding protein [Eubacteriales bacterium]MDY3286167.1 phosphopantetheine-binding protein [Eubacteriales bacterium]MDY5016708.1 phosphopantetheine-binding protein [Eubacteriales bacterium]
MVFEKIVAVLKEKLGDDVVIERETLLRDLGVDSLDVAEILMTLEDEFGIQIDTDGVKLDTAGDFADLVEGLVKKA